MGLDNPLHIAFIVVILLLVFGARRLPEIGRSLGSGMREFKDSITGDSNAAAKDSSQATLASGPPAQQPVAQPPQPAEAATPVGAEASAPAAPPPPA